MCLQKTLLLLVISLSIFPEIFGQKSKSETIESIVKEIAANDIYERSYTVGYSGTVSRQMELFEKLISYTSESELTKIALNNKNAVVRLYALQGIRRKAKIISEAVFKIFNSDSSEVITLTRCFGNKKLVRSLFFDPIIEGQNKVFDEGKISFYKVK